MTPLEILSRQFQELESGRPMTFRYPNAHSVPEHKNWTSDAWAPPGQSVRIPDARAPIRPSISAARSSSCSTVERVTSQPMLRSSACAHISGRECGDERVALSLTVES